MPPTVLILGAGINGSALARELALNDVDVTLVDTGDIAAGTTAYSSRLIHGGLRYLEYGEFDLVKESLGERKRLLRLAPHLVRPLELFVPVANRLGGLITSARRFLRLGSGSTKARGVWLVRMGLAMYDAYAHDPSVPRHRVYAGDEPRLPRVDRRAYPWLCSYYDAQVAFPERFTLALVEDARRAAAERGRNFQLLTYHEARLDGRRARISPVAGDGPTIELAPDLVINATGAWVDETLQRLQVTSKRLLRGTKGSHFFTFHTGLRRELAGAAIYGEAEDGRPVFILPLGEGTLVGTTDLPYEAAPETAVATEEELDYLLRLVRQTLPGAGLARGDIVWHYAGVRPLPATDASSTASITRRHWLEEQPAAPLPMYSLVGGKLTTCRSLAESATPMLLKRLGTTVRVTSAERPLPGAESHPRTADAVNAALNALAAAHGITREHAASLWSLCGTRAAEVLQSYPECAGKILADTTLPLAMVRWAIAREWAVRLDDLVERRLMLLYQPRFSRATLAQLADELVSAGRLSASDRTAEIERTAERLASHFGKRL